MDTDTIAAIATAMSQAGIGIVRISGPEAVFIADRIFVSKNKNKHLSQVDSHTIHYGKIYDGDRLLDEVLVSVMRGPHSYTGEDVVEINGHGGVRLLIKILETVLKNGARPAEAGEFTKRAFLNGRMDLSQAEAVMDLIKAQNDFAMKASISQLEGGISDKIKSMREKILYHMAFIESALDDPEHISVDGYGETLRAEILPLREEIRRMYETAENGRILSEGIKTVILGKPNAGKSSLLNSILGKDRAIVTDIPGTTRDTLEEQIMLEGISLRVTDTAGIRDTKDQVEKIGVDRAMEEASAADLILFVVDSSRELDENDLGIIDFIKDKKAIVLFNKTDLSSVVDKEKIEKLTGKDVIPVSAKEGTGMEDFTGKVKELFRQGLIGGNDQVIITNIRHKEALKEAYESLSLVINSIEEGMPEDFYSIDLMGAYEKLGNITGESVGEDLVNEIFSKFCMGK